MSRVWLSSSFYHVKNVRNFSVVTSNKSWDNLSYSKPSSDSRQRYFLYSKNPSLQSFCHPVFASRWISSGNACLAATSLPEVPDTPLSGTVNPVQIRYSLPELPEPPIRTLPVTTEKIVELMQNGEPTLSSIGLGGWWPKGLFQEGLMAIHVNFGLPWWATIMLGALIMRAAMFPLSLKSQRAGSRIGIYMPQITEAYSKMTEARKQDDPYLVYKYGKQVEELQKAAGNPLAQVLPGLAQAPFIYFFFSALREMSTFPLESFKTGGTLWFTDLTVTDSYYGIPALTAVGLFATLKLSSSSFAAIKYGFLIPYAALPFSFIITMFFTNAIGVYWLAASVLNFAQAVALRNPQVREFLKLGPLPPPAQKPAKKKDSKGFWKDMRQNMENSRIAREVDDRFRLDSIAFEKAGKDPIKKTFKIDPTKSKAW